MKYQKIIAATIMLTLLTIAFVLEPAQAGTLAKVSRPARSLLKKAPNPFVTLLANSPELVWAGKKILRIIQKIPPLPPQPTPLLALFTIIVASYVFEPDEFTPPPEAPRPTGQFYNDTPLFDFDQP